MERNVIGGINKSQTFCCHAKLSQTSRAYQGLGGTVRMIPLRHVYL